MELIAKICPICKITKNCDPKGCIRCFLSGRVDVGDGEAVRLQSHNCEECAVPYESDGALGHGWECGRCGRFLQAG